MKFRHLLMMFCLIVGLSCSGCSLIPHLSFNRPGMIPQSTEKSNKNIKCAGELKIGIDGSISCTKDFYSNENLFNQIERKTTLKEKIINFFSGLAGWGFWIVVLLLILCPSLGGLLIGRVFNVFKTGLSATVEAISNFKDKAKQSNDPVYIKAANDLMDELSKSHQDAGVQNIINKIRAEISSK